MFVLNTFVIFAPFAWGTSCWFGLKAITEEPKSWRNRVSICSLTIVTLAGLLWLPAALFLAHKRSGSNFFGTAHGWAAMAILICACALVLSLFGKPRLVTPIVFTCLGTASFWFGTTIP